MKYRNSWHLMSSDRVIEAFMTDMYRGLSSDEAELRRRRFGSNDIWHVAATSVKNVILDSVFDMAVLLLFISFIIAALFERNTGTVLMAVVLVAGFAIHMLVRFTSVRIIENSEESKIPTATVLRDGRIKCVSARDLVPGDIVFIEAGETVPCDGRVVSDYDATVSEKNVTGNKGHIHKFDTVITTDGDTVVPCEFRSNMLFAGSVLISGAARIVATGCGKRSLVVSSRGSIDVSDHRTVSYVESASRFGRYLSLAVIAVSLILLVVTIFTVGITSGINVLLSLLIAAGVSAGNLLRDAAVMAMAVSIRRAGKLMGRDDETSLRFRDLEKIKNVSDTDYFVVCGSEFYRSGNVEIVSSRYKDFPASVENGEEEKAGEEKTGAEKTGAEKTAGDAEADPVRPPVIPGQSKDLEKLLELASLATMAGKTGLTTDRGFARLSANGSVVERSCAYYRRVTGRDILPECGVLDHAESAAELRGKLDTSIVTDAGRMFAVTCGEIGDVLECCGYVDLGKGPEPFPKDLIDRLRERCAELGKYSSRILGVCMKDVNYQRIDRPALLNQYMVFVGYFAVAREPEKAGACEAGDYLGRLEKSGVSAVILSEEPVAGSGETRLSSMSDPVKVVRLADYDDLDPESCGGEPYIIDCSGYNDNYTRNVFLSAFKKIREKAADASEFDEEVSMTVAGAAGTGTPSLAQADAALVIDNIGYRNLPDAVGRAASAVISTDRKKAVSGYGGFIGSVETVSVARHIIGAIESSKRYILASHTAKLVFMVFCLICDYTAVIPLFILTWGVIADWLYVLATAFSFRAEHIFRKTSGRKTESVAVPLLLGLVWGALPPLTAVLAGRASGSQIASVLSTGLSGSLIYSNTLILGLCVSVALLIRAGNVSFRRLSATQAAVYAAAVIISLVTAFAGNGLPGLWILCGIAAGGAMLMIPVILWIRAVRGKRPTGGEDE